MTHQQARLHQIPDACDRLGVGRSSVYGLIRTGQLRSVKVGKRRLIPEEAINEFIARISEHSGAA